MKKNCFNVSSVPLDHSPCVKPTIVTDPQSANLDQNESVVLTVLASGTNPKTYQWYKENVPISGETSDSLTLLYVNLVDAGEYRVNVMNACGSAMSDTAVVVVNDIGACEPPEITVHPQSEVAEWGESVTFSVGLTGTMPLTYQWKKDNVNIPGATNSTYAVIYANDDAEGIYSVEIENACGSVLSGGAILIVNPALNPDCPAPVITVQPLSHAIDEGTSITLTVTATGGPLTYQWKKDEVDIPGATSPTLDIIYAVEDDQANYRVVVTNACGSVSSEIAFVEVEVPDDGGGGDDVFFDEEI